MLAVLAALFVAAGGYARKLIFVISPTKLQKPLSRVPRLVSAYLICPMV